MFWKLYVSVALCNWLLVSTEGRREWGLPPDQGPYWIDDAAINWRNGTFNTTGSRNDCHTDLPYITRPSYGEYKFLEIGFKVCGAHYKGFGVYLTNAGKRTLKIRIKWQEVSPWTTQCYFEPDAGKIFFSMYVTFFTDWPNQLIFSPLRNLTNEDDRGIWFYYKGKL